MKALNRLTAGLSTAVFIVFLFYFIVVFKGNLLDFIIFVIGSTFMAILFITVILIIIFRG
jgi:hypothetical protein